MVELRECLLDEKNYFVCLLDDHTISLIAAPQGLPLIEQEELIAKGSALFEEIKKSYDELPIGGYLAVHNISITDTLFVKVSVFESGEAVQRSFLSIGTVQENDEEMQLALPEHFVPFTATLEAFIEGYLDDAPIDFDLCSIDLDLTESVKLLKIKFSGGQISLSRREARILLTNLFNELSR